MKTTMKMKVMTATRSDDSLSGPENVKTCNGLISTFVLSLMFLLWAESLFAVSGEAVTMQLRRRPTMTKPLQRLILVLGMRQFATSALLVAALLTIPSAQAQTYAKTTLHYYTGQLDGSSPSTRLILDKAGNVYGITQTGGVYNQGTVFKIDTSGNYTILYSFGAPRSASGPIGRLTMDTAGNLYGTAGGGFYGQGTVYKLDTSGNLTVLYNFNGGQYGGSPIGGLLYVEAQATFFGTTSQGGARNGCGGSGCGVVFKLKANSSGGWTLTVLHVFTGTPDGQSPQGELTRDAQGYLYGTTRQGGASNLGTVFKVRARQETVLYSFKDLTDGFYPSSGLLLDAGGNLYGTTANGGGGTKCIGGSSNGGCGTIYKVDASGTKTVLYAFTGRADGAGPDQRLVRDAAGNLYGTTQEGGEKPYSGTAYKLDTTGTETVVYNFLVGKDGVGPVGLAIDGAGNLYGVTEGGGLNSCYVGQSCGTVFKLTLD
jgi:uncharacterized repeat protein (TIGR03803 family)